MSEKPNDPATEAVIAICRIMAALPEVHRERAERALHALTAPDSDTYQGMQVIEGLAQSAPPAAT